MDPCPAMQEIPGGRTMTSPWSTHPWRCGGARMKKIEMDGKNFASRCYHRVDAVSRSLAQTAYKDALKFAALKIGTVEPPSQRSKAKKGTKQ